MAEVPWVSRTAGSKFNCFLPAQQITPFLSLMSQWLIEPMANPYPVAVPYWALGILYSLIFLYRVRYASMDCIETPSLLADLPTIRAAWVSSHTHPHQIYHTGNFQQNQWRNYWDKSPYQRLKSEMYHIVNVWKWYISVYSWFHGIVI